MIPRLFLAIEFLLLCVAFPTSIIVFRLAPYMLLLLWGAAIYCYVVYKRHYHQDLKEIWKWKSVTWENMKPILVRWAICCVLMSAFIYFYDPDRMFNLINRRPGFIFALFVIYPVLSALPQEFIFCSYFFKRYDYFFPTNIAKVIASAITFAYAHMLFINPVAPTLSLVAGLIFAHTYVKHKSLALVTIEHGLYGNFLFLIGLGYYFYHGAVVIR